jgi:hypothetical protein
VSNKNNTLLIKPGQKNIDISNFEALFLNDEHIELAIVDEDRIQISTFNNYSSIFLYELTSLSTGLTGELKKYVENGGNLTFIPSFTGNINEYNSLLTALDAATFSEADTNAIPISELAYSHPLFTGVFKGNDSKVQLPTVGKRYRFTANQNISEVPIMVFADKSNALTVKPFGKGKLYTFAFPFSEKGNRFTEHLLFIPTIYNIALYASSYQQLYSVLGKDKFVYCNNPFDKVMQSPVLKNKLTLKEFIPSNVKQEGNQIQMSIDVNMDAGLYLAKVGTDEIGGVAVNYNLTESDLTSYTTDELKTLIGQSGIKKYNLLNENNSDLSATIAELDSGKQYWKLFIFIALFFILLEASIIRLWDKIFYPKKNS